MKRYGLRITLVSLFLLLCSTGSIAIETEKSDASYVESLLELADQKMLSADPYWHILLHYKKTIFGTKSLIDDPRFFLAKDGKSNPKSEMQETLKAFFLADETEENHPICRFAARYTWLKEKLHIDDTKLPFTECKKIKNMINTIQPSSANMIFPTSHINSPASMFGHTLITIENSYKNKLLSNAINYSAVTPETFGPLFAVKGIFGLYKGYFSMQPYYEKVQEYSDFDHRDIWEYRLNLTVEEISKMLLHVFELNFIYSDYYFFDENCSYNLLFLLDSARPSLDLSGKFYLALPHWVIPIDTIREAEKSGLIDTVVYRPSRSTTIKSILNTLSGKNRDTALSIIKRKMPPEGLMDQSIPDEEKIRICDLVIEYTQYRYSKDDMTKQQYTDIFLKMLGIRSKLGKPDENRYTIMKPVQPDMGHLSSRVSMGMGIKEDLVYQEFRYRPSYHALIDADNGYISGGQIVFGDLALRYYSSDKKIEVDKFDIIDIISLSPWNRFFKSISWKISTGLEQKIFPDKNDHLVYNLNPGAGIAFNIPFLGLFYMLTETELDAGSVYDDTFAAGIGGSAGFLQNLAHFWKVHLYARNIYYAVGDTYNFLELVIFQNFKLTRNSSITAGFARELVFETISDHGVSRNDFNVSLNIFF